MDYQSLLQMLQSIAPQGNAGNGMGMGGNPQQAFIDQLMAGFNPSQQAYDVDPVAAAQAAQAQAQIVQAQANPNNDSGFNYNGYHVMPPGWFPGPINPGDRGNEGGKTNYPGIEGPGAPNGGGVTNYPGIEGPPPNNHHYIGPYTPGGPGMHPPAKFPNPVRPINPGDRGNEGTVTNYPGIEGPSRPGLGYLNGNGTPEGNPPVFQNGGRPPVGIGAPPVPRDPTPPAPGRPNDHGPITGVKPRVPTPATPMPTNPRPPMGAFQNLLGNFPSLGGAGAALKPGGGAGAGGGGARPTPRNGGSARGFGGVTRGAF